MGCWRCGFSKRQVIVTAEAFGEAQEYGLLEPMVRGTREDFKAIGTDESEKGLDFPLLSTFKTPDRQRQLLPAGRILKNLTGENGILNNVFIKSGCSTDSLVRTSAPT